jgi:iron complex outermembrane recepter protein
MPPPCLAGANNLNDRNLRSTYTGTRSRVNLTWRVTPDVMVYYTFSQGFRPGGFNRATTNVPNLNFTTPQGFAPDTLTNNEIGAKSEWFDHRLQFNLAAYHEKWTNVQVQFYDPYGLLGNQGFETNGPNYVVRGVETQIEARATRELTFNGSASWNSSSMTNSPFLVNNAGQPITEIKDPFGVTGDSLAMSPPFQANARIRYEFVSLPYQPFFQLGMQHSAHSHSGTGYAPNNFEQPGWTQYDVSSGVSRGDWSVQAYCDNFTDHRSLLYINNYQWVLAETVSRPRTAGLKFSYKFKGS